MAAATGAPARPRAPRAARVVPVSAARLLWVELRRGAMPWILPLIAALFWFDSYRPSTQTEPLYVVRTFWNMGQGHTIVDFGPFVAAVAAWMGSRDGRRGLADLVTTTARPRWIAQLVTWAATAIWAVAAYLAFVGVMFAMYAHQGVTGAPPWWWVAVGAVSVAALTAAGFAVGAWWPSRFAAPVAAFGAVLVLLMASQTGFHHGDGWALILPTNSNGSFQNDSGISYPWLPDVPIARLIFLAGLVIAILGLTGLPARAGGPGLRRAAAVAVVAGVALAATGIGLVSTARLTPHGMAIPALHDAADDAPAAYTPACGQAAGVPVCLNPAYQRWLPVITSALAPELAEVAGLPGGPARAAQVATDYTGTSIEGAPPALSDGGPPQALTLRGRPPVLGLSLGLLNMPGPCGFCDGPVGATGFTSQFRLMFAHAFVGAGRTPGSPAQQAVQAALLNESGVPFAEQAKAMGTADNFPGPAPLSATGPVFAAARRFAAQPAAARHAWLAAHLAALRAGHLTLRELP